MYSSLLQEEALLSSGLGQTSRQSDTSRINSCNPFTYAVWMEVPDAPPFNGESQRAVALLPFQATRCSTSKQQVCSYAAAGLHHVTLAVA